MTAANALPKEELESIDEPDRAAVVLNPLRLRILRCAQSPCSATEIAAKLELSRQKVNYHVKELARVHFLRKAGRRKKRNLYEQRYVATATSYALSPTVLGPLEADPRHVADKLSAAFLLTLGIRMQRELSVAMNEATAQKKKLSTLSLESEFRFESARQREEFTRDLRDAVTEVVQKHTSPMHREDGSAAPGRPFRLVLGCHPIPPEFESSSSGKE